MQDPAALLGVCFLCFCVALVPSLTQKDHKSQFNSVVQFSRQDLNMKRNCFLESEFIDPLFPHLI